MLIKQLNVISKTNLKLYAFSIFAFFLGTGLEKMTVLSLLVLVLVSLLGIKKKMVFDEGDKKVAFLFLGLFLFIVLYAIIFSEYKYIERNISFVLFPLLCFYFNKNEIRSLRFTKKVCFSFSLGLIMYPLVIILVYMIFKIPTEAGKPLDISSLYQLKRIIFSTNILKHTFHNVYYATYSICSIVFLYWMLKGSTNKILIYVFIFLHFFFIFLSAGRISYILIGLLAIVFFTNQILKKNKKIFYLVPVFVFLVFFLFNQYPYLQYKFIKSFPEAINTRLLIWSNSYEIIKDNILGLGFSDFHRLLNFKNKQVLPEIVKDLNSHNQYLEYFGGLGILGGLYFLLLLSYIVKIVVRGKNLTLMLFMLIMLVSFVTESWFVRQYGIVFFMFFLCFFWNKKQSSNNVLHSR